MFKEELRPSQHPYKSQPWTYRSKLLDPSGSTIRTNLNGILAKAFAKALLPACAASAIALASSTSTAHAQSFSINEMLQPGGIDVGLGINATATIVTPGTGSVLSPGHGAAVVAGQNIGGGAFTGAGFDPSRPTGPVTQATRVRPDPAGSIDDGSTTGYADAIGFHVTFSSPIPLNYFYGLDIEASEWKTSLAFNGATPILPAHILGSTQTLQTSSEMVDVASWATAFGLTPPANVPITFSIPGAAATLGVAPVGPDTPEGQVIFDYAGATATDVIFLYGFENPGDPSGSSNSAVSALTLEIPQLNTTKSASVGAVQADGTVDVTYTLNVENSGSYAIESLTLTDELTAAGQLENAFNGVVTPPNVVLTNTSGSSTAPGANLGYDGGTTDDDLIATSGNLQPGDSYAVTFTVNVDPNAAGAPGTLPNIASAGGTSPSFPGASVTDDSDPEGSPDPGGAGSSVTITLPAAAPSLETTKSAVVPGAQEADGSVNVTYTLTVENTGDVNLENLTLTDALDATGQLGAAFNNVVGAVQLTGAPTGITANAGFDGTAAGDPALISVAGGAVLAPSASFDVEFTVNIDPEATSNFANSATATGADPSGTVLTDLSDNDASTGNSTDGPAAGVDPNGSNVTVIDPPLAPTTVADESLDNAIGTSPEVDVIANDSADTGRTLDPTSVALVDPTTGNPVASLVVANQGTWSVNPTTGTVTFTPLPTFTGNPTPVNYTVDDDQGNTSDPAAVTVTYTGAPIAVADESLGNALGTAPEVDVLANDAADTGRTLDPTTVALVDPVTGNPVASLVVANQGTWSVNATTGAVTFTPLATFTGNPAPVNYTVDDDQGNTSAPTAVTVTYTGAPIAVADESLGNALGTAPEVDVLANDTADTGRTLDPTTVALVDPATGNPVASLVVANQGTWSVNATTGAVTFTPLATFTGNPDLVSYTVNDDQGNTSAPATVTVTYTVAPTAVADESLGNETGQPVSLAVLSNDNADTGRTLDPTTVALVDPATGNPVTSLVVTGQGTWSVSPTGIVTFTPEAAFTGSPDPVSYTVDDDQGNTSAPALITVGYEQPVNIEVIETILSDDLQRTTEMLSRNVSDISRRAADRLSIAGGRECGAQINDLLKQNPIYFATDKFFIDARNNAVLDEIALILGNCPGASFMIAGHTDSRASDAYNLVLSQNRVDAVQDALIRRGIADARLETEGFGERRPIATNSTDEGMALNRRVEFILLSEGDGLGEDFASAGRCGEDSTLVRNLDGSANNAGSNLTGNYHASGYNCLDGTHREVWADLSVSSTDDAGTTGMLSFGASRERQANNRLFGQFIEGYLSETNVDSTEATGSITGVGIHAGLFGAAASEQGLLFNYYGSVGLGRHSFDLTAGGNADGHYDYAGLFVGGAIGGKQELENLTLAPRVGIDLAYSETVGSEISVPGVDLEIDPATYGRLFAEVDLIHALDEGEIELTPRVFCAVSGEDAATDCGFGASISYETFAEAENAQWDVTLDYDQISDTQTASLNVARSRQIFDGAGVSKSSLGATQAGSLSAEQTIEFSW